MTKEQLAVNAKEAMKNAYSPYSGYRVGAALLCKDGTVYTGCNVENASFGVTNCAERTAVFSAVSEGQREFEAIAIVGGHTDGLLHFQNSSAQAHDTVGNTHGTGACYRSAIAVGLHVDKGTQTVGGGGGAIVKGPLIHVSGDLLGLGLAAGAAGKRSWCPRCPGRDLRLHCPRPSCALFPQF